MSGCSIPHTPIAVDCWRKRQVQSKICFLSHMHADHTQGLTSSWNQVIYCSEITRSLAIEKLKIQPSLMIAIPVGESTIIPLDDAGVENMTVTLIDANHCAGAVMILFQGYFGCILHTGDFRYFDGMLDIPPFTNGIVINTLHLDNTYCDPKCEFPSRAEAKETILEIIHKNPGKDIRFGLDTLGKEELLCEVAKDQGVPIFVEEKLRYKAAELLGYSEYFTRNPEETFIKVMNKRSVNRGSLAYCNNHCPTIGILPSGIYQGKNNPFAKNDTIFVVPYSDHSSFSELKAFVAKLRPQRIFPVVSRSRKDEEDPHDRSDMTIFAAEISSNAGKHVFDVPPTVRAFMSGNYNGSRNNGSVKRKASTSYFNSRSKRPAGVVFSPEKQATACKDKDEVTVEQERNISTEPEADTDVASLSSSTIVNEDLHAELVSKTRQEETAPPTEEARTKVRDDNQDVRTQNSSEKSLAMVDSCLPGNVEARSTSEENSKKDPTSVGEKTLETTTLFAIGLKKSKLTETNDYECSPKVTARHVRQDETHPEREEAIPEKAGDERVVESCPAVSLEPKQSLKTSNSVPLPDSASSNGSETSCNEANLEPIKVLPQGSEELQLSKHKSLPVSTEMQASKESPQCASFVIHAETNSPPPEGAKTIIQDGNHDIEIQRSVEMVESASKPLPDNDEARETPKGISKGVSIFKNTLASMLSGIRLRKTNEGECLPRLKPTHGREKQDETQRADFQSKLQLDKEETNAQISDDEQTTTDDEEQDNQINENDDGEISSANVLGKAVGICANDQGILLGSTGSLEPTDNKQSPNLAPQAESSKGSETTCDENSLAPVELAQDSEEDLRINRAKMVRIPTEILESNASSTSDQGNQQLSTPEQPPFPAELQENHGSLTFACSQSQSSLSNTEMSGEMCQENGTEQHVLPRKSVPNEISQQINLNQPSEMQCEASPIEHTEALNGSETTLNGPEIDDPQTTTSKDSNAQELSEIQLRESEGKEEYPKPSICTETSTEGDSIAADVQIPQIPSTQDVGESQTSISEHKEIDDLQLLQQANDVQFVHSEVDNTQEESGPQTRNEDYLVLNDTEKLTAFAERDVRHNILNKVSNTQEVASEFQTRNEDHPKVLNDAEPLIGVAVDKQNSLSKDSNTRQSKSQIRNEECPKALNDAEISITTAAAKGKHNILSEVSSAQEVNESQTSNEEHPKILDDAERLTAVAEADGTESTLNKVSSAEEVSEPQSYEFSRNEDYPKVLNEAESTITVLEENGELIRLSKVLNTQEVGQSHIGESAGKEEYPKVMNSAKEQNTSDKVCNANDSQTHESDANEVYLKILNDTGTPIRIEVDDVEQIIINNVDIIQEVSESQIDESVGKEECPNGTEASIGCGPKYLTKLVKRAETVMQVGTQETKSNESKICERTETHVQEELGSPSKIACGKVTSTQKLSKYRTYECDVETGLGDYQQLTKPMITNMYENTDECDPHLNVGKRSKTPVDKEAANPPKLSHNRALDTENLSTSPICERGEVSSVEEPSESEIHNRPEMTGNGVSSTQNQSTSQMSDCDLQEEAYPNQIKRMKTRINEIANPQDNAGSQNWESDCEKVYPKRVKLMKAPTDENADDLQIIYYKGPTSQNEVTSTQNQSTSQISDCDLRKDECPNQIKRVKTRINESANPQNNGDSQNCKSDCEEVHPKRVKLTEDENADDLHMIYYKGPTSQAPSVSARVSEQRQHTENAVSGLKTRRRKPRGIYTGDVSFARAVLERWERENLHNNADKN